MGTGRQKILLKYGISRGRQSGRLHVIIKTVFHIYAEYRCFAVYRYSAEYRQSLYKMKQVKLQKQNQRDREQ